MTIAVLELVFSASFLMFMNACTVFAFVSEEKRLRAMRTVVALFRKDMA